jgi:hypothetical protein
LRTVEHRSQLNSFRSDPARQGTSVEELHATSVLQAREELVPMAGGCARKFDECYRQQNQAVEQIVQFVLISNVGKDLAADLLNRGRIEAPCALQNRIRKGSAKIYGAGTALFQPGFV